MLIRDATPSIPACDSPRAQHPSYRCPRFVMRVTILIMVNCGMPLRLRCMDGILQGIGDASIPPKNIPVVRVIPSVGMLLWQL